MKVRTSRCTERQVPGRQIAVRNQNNGIARRLKYNFNREGREKGKEVEIKRYQDRIDGELKKRDREREAERRTESEGVCCSELVRGQKTEGMIGDQSPFHPVGRGDEVWLIRVPPPLFFGRLSRREIRHPLTPLWPPNLFVDPTVLPASKRALS